MPNLMLDLEVDRVDLVDEGANSEAAIRLYKRKENDTIMGFEDIIAKMKPEHAEVIKSALQKVTADLATAKTELEVATTDLAKTKEELSVATTEVAKMKEAASEEPSTEDVIKNLDPAVQDVFKSLKAQKEAAEAVVKQLNDKKLEDEAIAKAKELKGLPVEETKLVAVVKSVSDDVYDVLKAASAAIESSDMFTEVGKANTESDSDAWSKIEKKAVELSETAKISKQKAIAHVIKDNPDLYREYLKGGAN